MEDKIEMLLQRQRKVTEMENYEKQMTEMEKRGKIFNLLIMDIDKEQVRINKIEKPKIQL